MDRLKEYRVALRGLEEGVHSFEFLLDQTFFTCFEGTKETVGEVKAWVNVIKSSLLMEVRLKIDGTVRAVCDRCLEEMELPVRGEMKLFVKYGEREEGNEDDFIVLSSEEDYLDLSPLLYEIYMLNYPLRVVHPEGACSPEMENFLNKLIVEESEKIDPRWDELKKLINN